MGWTAPKTWVAGSPLTAAEGNEQWRDNLTWLKDALTALGQTSDSANKSLKSAICGARATRGSDQTISDSTWTSVNWTDEAWDTANGAGSTFHDNASNNERITIPSGLDGYYQIEGNIIWDSNTTGRRALRILLNGTTHIALVRATAVSGGATGTAQTISAVYSLSAGDYVELGVWQDSGGNRTVDGTTFGSLPHFTAYRVGV